MMSGICVGVDLNCRVLRGYGFKQMGLWHLTELASLIFSWYHSSSDEKHRL